MSTENINKVEEVSTPPAKKIDEAELYSEAMQILEIKSDKLELYKKAKDLLEQIPNYRNAQKLLADCDARIESIRRRMDEKRRKKAKTIRNIIVVVVIAIIGAIAVGAMATANSQDAKDYESAMSSLAKAEESGKESTYTIAYNNLTRLGEYKNSGKTVMESYFKRVKKLADDASYSAAFKLLEKGLESEASVYATPEMVTDVQTYLTSTIFNDANTRFAAGDYYNALDLYGLLDVENPDIIAKMDDCKFQSIVTGKVGSVVKYGSYEVDADVCDYADSVDWIVLAKEGNKFLLITKEVIDVKPYNREYTVTNWTGSSIREWLNSDFVDRAFSDSEEAKINAVAGDKVFLLTAAEAEKYLTDDIASATPTPFALYSGAMLKDGACAGWWLADTTAEGDAAVVDSDGNICKDGYNVSKATIGVRPAIWVTID